MKKGMNCPYNLKGNLKLSKLENKIYNRLKNVVGGFLARY